MSLERRSGKKITVLVFLTFSALANHAWCADETTWEDPNENILLGWIRVRIKDFTPTIADNPSCSETAQITEASLDSCNLDQSPCSTKVLVVCTAVHSDLVVFNSTFAVCAAARDQKEEDMSEVVIYQTHKRHYVEDDVTARFVNGSIPNYLRHTCDLPDNQFTSEMNVCQYLTCNMENNLKCTVNNETPVVNFQCATLNLNASSEPPWLQQNSSSPERTPVLKELPPTLVSANIVYLVATSLLLLIIVLVILCCTFAVLYCKAKKCCCYQDDELGEEIVEMEIRPQRAYQTGETNQSSSSNKPVYQSFAPAAGYENLGASDREEEGIYQVPVDCKVNSKGEYEVLRNIPVYDGDSDTEKGK